MRRFSEQSLRNLGAAGLMLVRLRRGHIGHPAEAFPLCCACKPLINSLEGILGDADDILDFSHLLDWTLGFMLIQGGSRPITRIAS